MARYSEEWWRRRINLAEDYWNTQDSPIRRQMMKEIRKLSFESILEVGCCSGPNLALIKKEFPDVRIAGVDINEPSIEFAKEKLDADLKVANATNLPYPDNSFDIVLTNATLMYVNDIDKAVSEIKRVVKKWVVMVELHTAGLPMGDENHIVRNYNKYFKGCSLTKVNSNEEPWSSYGYIIKYNAYKRDKQNNGKKTKMD